MPRVSIVSQPGLWELESAPSLAAVNRSPCGPGHRSTPRAWEESREAALFRGDAHADAQAICLELVFASFP